MSGTLLGTLTVTLLRVRGLLPTDVDGDNDSYCEFIGPDGIIHNTSAIIVSLNPDWEALGAGAKNITSFKIRPKDVERKITLLFWDEDPFGRDFNGEIQVAIRDITGDIAKSGERSLPLSSRKSETNTAVKEAKSLGIASIRFDWAPAPKQAVIPPAGPNFLTVAGSELPEIARQGMLPGAFLLTILRAQGLINRDVVGLSDPYVSVYDLMDEEIYRTPVIDDTLDPDWSGLDCEVLIRVPTVLASQGDVTMRIWDADTSGKDFLGEVALSVPKMMAKAHDGSTFVSTTPLQPRHLEKDKVILSQAQLGTLSFMFRWLSEGEAQKHSSFRHPSEHMEVPKSYVPFSPCKAVVHIRRCTNLHNPDALDIASPYILVTGAAHHRTKCVDRDLSPVYEESFDAFDPQDGFLSEKLLTFAVKNSMSAESEACIGIFSSTINQLSRRAFYSLVENRQGELEDSERGICVQLRKTIDGPEDTNREGSGVYGSLILWVTLELPRPSELPSALCLPTAVAHSLTVYVRRGFKLRNPRGNKGVPMPFVRVYLDEIQAVGSTVKAGPEVLRTIAVEGENPVWHGESTIEVNFQATNDIWPSDFDSKLLTFDVTDEDPYSDTVIGSCTVSLRQLSQRAAFAMRYDGQGQAAPETREFKLNLIDSRRQGKHKQRKLVDKVNVFGTGEGGALYLWTEYN